MPWISCGVGLRDDHLQALVVWAERASSRAKLQCVGDGLVLPTCRKRQTRIFSKTVANSDSIRLNNFGDCCAMRVETIKAWVLVGFGLLAIGTVLNLLQFAGHWGIFLAVMGVVYFCIGMLLSVIRDRHMNTRTRAG